MLGDIHIRWQSTQSSYGIAGRAGARSIMIQKKIEHELQSIKQFSITASIYLIAATLARGIQGFGPLPSTVMGLIHEREHDKHSSFRDLQEPRKASVDMGHLSYESG